LCVAQLIASMICSVMAFLSHVVSSSEEQSAQLDMMQTGGIVAHWWHVDATPSTSSERDGSSAGSNVGSKRQRDEGRTYVLTNMSIYACS